MDFPQRTNHHQSAPKTLTSLGAVFAVLSVDEAKRLKELERENSELKKMLAESLLKNRVLEAICEKKL